MWEKSDLIEAGLNEDTQEFRKYILFNFELGTQLKTLGQFSLYVFLFTICHVPLYISAVAS
jgi:hypothetical protein